MATFHGTGFYIFMAPVILLHMVPVTHGYTWYRFTGYTWYRLNMVPVTHIFMVPVFVYFF